VLTIGSFWSTKDETIQDRLNELGEEGWEMVGFQTTSTDKVRVIGKRPLTAASRRRRARNQEGM
jgi:hypothetical protein